MRIENGVLQKLNKVLIISFNNTLFQRCIYKIEDVKFINNENQYNML